MQTLQITIKDPKAEKLLWNLADMELIEIREIFDDPTEEFKSEEDPKKFVRQAGWGKDIFGEIRPSFYEPMEEFKEYE